MKKHSVHDYHVYDLMDRLLQKKYALVISDYHYKTFTLEGQVDVLAARDTGNKRTIHFYEVKCHYSQQNHEKAKQQYERFKKVYPDWNTKGILYTPERVVRL